MENQIFSGKLQGHERSPTELETSKLKCTLYAGSASPTVTVFIFHLSTHYRFLKKVSKLLISKS